MVISRFLTSNVLVVPATPGIVSPPADAPVTVNVDVAR
jgi:hypothetical protein